MTDWLQKGNTTSRQHFTTASVTLPLTQAWKTRLRDSILQQPIAVSDSVYVCSLGALYRLDMQTGAVLWEYPYVEPPSPRINAIKVSPAIAGERVFFTDMIGTLYCLDRTNGALLWKRENLGAGNEPLCVDSGHLFTCVKQVGGTKTVQGYACLDLDGNVVWFQPSEGIPSTKAAIAQGKLVFGDQKGFVYALDTAKGTVVWKINLQGSITTQKPRRGVGSREGTYACELPRIVNDTIVFYVNNKANLCGVDLSTGALKWHLRADADLPLGGCAQCLGSDEQSLYYVTRNFFRWVDAASGDITLTIDHQHHALKESMAWAGLVAGRYYFAAFNMSRKIVAFDTETGAIAWEFQEEDDHGGFSDAGIYTHGKFIIGRDSGHVYCFS